MEEKELGSVTVNFLTLDICGLPKMPFPECCNVLERGQGYAGEGDVLTAGLVGSLFAAYPNTTFTESDLPLVNTDGSLEATLPAHSLALIQFKLN